MGIKLLILLLFFSCSTRKHENKEQKTNNIIDVSNKKIYDYENKIFNLLIDYKISNDHFVFTKYNESFQSTILTTVQIFDIGGNAIILQESWESNILEKFYNQTRSVEEMFEFNKEISLLEGDYIIKIHVKDLDNNNVYTFKDKISLSTTNGLGEVLLYEKQITSNNQEILKEIDKSFNQNDSQIKILFQYFQDS